MSFINPTSCDELDENIRHMRELGLDRKLGPQLQGWDQYGRPAQTQLLGIVVWRYREMQLEMFATYKEANEAIGLPRGTGSLADLTPIAALDKDTHLEQYSCVVYVRKWTYDGNEGSPDLSFIGLECGMHFCDGYKTDIFIYKRIDGNDSQS